MLMDGCTDALQVNSDLVLSERRIHRSNPENGIQPDDARGNIFDTLAELDETGLSWESTAEPPQPKHKAPVTIAHQKIEGVGREYGDLKFNYVGDAPELSVS
ncbi:MAG: hypothetical protein KDA53_08340, partial [Hyphomonas sp.]|nr:hypothetical protein [Hyphomonas sp.]